MNHEEIFRVAEAVEREQGCRPGGGFVGEVQDRAGRGRNGGRGDAERGEEIQVMIDRVAAAHRRGGDSVVAQPPQPPAPQEGSGSDTNPGPGSQGQQG